MIDPALPTPSQDGHLCCHSSECSESECRRTTLSTCEFLEHLEKHAALRSVCYTFNMPALLTVVELRHARRISSHGKEKPGSLRHGPEKYRGRSAEHWCQDLTRPLWMAVLPWSPRSRKVHHKYLIDEYRFANEPDSWMPSLTVVASYVDRVVCSMALEMIAFQSAAWYGRFT